MLAHFRAKKEKPVACATTGVFLSRPEPTRQKSKEIVSYLSVVVMTGPKDRTVFIVLD